MAMPLPAAHFLHPKHELKLREYHMSRLCNLCGEKLTGGGYSCHRRICEFDLHEECATYEETLRSFFAHPQHALTLSDHRRSWRSTSCALCGEEAPAGGFLYRCAPCGFTVHPRCSRLPQTARSERVHPEHALTLTAASPAAARGAGAATCAACREPCGGDGAWVYRCELCDVELHVECLHGARGKNGKEGSLSSVLGVEALKTVTEVTMNMILGNP